MFLRLTFISVLSCLLLGADNASNINSVVCDPTETYCAGVELVDGKNRLLTDSVVTVEEVFGKDPHATSWFYIGDAKDADGVGAAGDTVRVQIPAAVSPIGTTLYPAVDVTTTVTAAMVAADNPEKELATQICLDLEADANFTLAEWDCIRIKDHSGVFIASELFNEFGERTSWEVTATGTTTVTKAFVAFERRGLPTELARSPNDPRQGILGISGTVISTPGGVGDIILENLKNAGSADMRVNGSGTSVAFRLECSLTKDRLIQEVRFYGGCNGMKFGQFLCNNQKLSSGIQITFVSEQNTLVLPVIQSTEDFKNKWSFGPAGAGSTFRIDIQAGGDQLTASLIFSAPAIIEKCGTNPLGNDYIQVDIQDRLDNIGLNEFEAIVRGFEEET